MQNNKTIKAMSALQDQWSSKWAFILAATGAAVGLGNIWRFPYMAGANGGSAFVLVYLICVLVIGIPIMIAEIIIGRSARRNAVDSMRNLAIEAGHSPQWGVVGWWGIGTLLLVLSFYSVVSGWTIAYLFRGFSGQFHGLNATEIGQTWQNFLASPWQLLAWHTLFMCLTIGIIVRGVQQGLEKATKILTPALYVILIILVIYAAIVGDFRQGFHFLFDFRFAKLTPAIIVAAMGHAFFTLALGAGAMLAYGAYVPKKVNIPQAVLVVAGLDVLVAVLSGLAIFPLVFAYHLPPQSGPGLMFVTLPITFAQISGGAVIGGLFFVLLLFAAWTSSINLAEPVVLILVQRLHITRTSAAIMVGVLAWTLGIVSILSFNVWQNIKIFNSFTIFDAITNVSTDILLPIGGLGFSLFAGWIMRRMSSQNEISGKYIYLTWRFLIRYIAPVAIILIFISAFGILK